MSKKFTKDFNPHEREARDREQGEHGVHQGHFNPHEREARDRDKAAWYIAYPILIHTSVKLVTSSYITMAVQLGF